MHLNERSLLEMLANGQVCYGMLTLLPGAPLAELMARTGPDFVVVDLQHGSVAEADLPGITSAIS